MEKQLLLTTTESVAGKEITQVLGLIKGNTVQTRHIGSHLLAGLISIMGGEVKGYGEAFSLAREEATERMVAEAQSLGADAIVSMRFSSSQILNGGAEILAYGTAVQLR